MMMLAVMAFNEQCPRCGLPFHTGAHVCIRKLENPPPEMAVIEESEVCGHIDFSAPIIDGIYRPVVMQQDDGSVLALTVKDAERIYHFLDEALPFLEGKIWSRQ